MKLNERFEKFIQSIINRLKNKFVPGSKHALANDSTFPQQSELRSQITPTLFAAQGPYNASQLEDLLNFILDLNPTAEEHHIIALGHILHCDPKKSDSVQKIADFLNYSIDSEVTDSRCTFNEDKTITITKDACIPSSVLVTQEDKTFTFHTTLYGIPDGDGLTLTTEEMVGTFFNDYKQSLTTVTVIHCYAGFGRTGHIIAAFLIFELMLLLVRDKIPPSGCDHELSNLILEVLENIREIRPGLVQTLQQFEKSIWIAAALFEYVLTNKLEHEITKLPPHISYLKSFKKYFTTQPQQSSTMAFFPPEKKEVKVTSANQATMPNHSSHEPNAGIKVLRGKLW